MGLMFAVRDTTSAALSWFFWLLSMNPFVESKIIEELTPQNSIPEAPNAGILLDIDVILCSYAMGRMEFIWGEHCLEFKPERWISEAGKVRLETSSKFLAFSSGPRICPGKELAFTRLKAVLATIIHNYHVQVVEGQEVTHVISSLLYIKNGLKVKDHQKMDLITRAVQIFCKPGRR